MWDLHWHIMGTELLSVVVLGWVVACHPQILTWKMLVPSQKSWCDYFALGCLLQISAAAAQRRHAFAPKNCLENRPVEAVDVGLLSLWKPSTCRGTHFWANTRMWPCQIFVCQDLPLLCAWGVNWDAEARKVWRRIFHDFAKRKTRSAWRNSIAGLQRRVWRTIWRTTKSLYLNDSCWVWIDVLEGGAPVRWVR